MLCFWPVVLPPSGKEKSFKGAVHQKKMQMQPLSRWKIRCSPQNISVASKPNCAVTLFATTEVAQH